MPFDFHVHGLWILGAVFVFIGGFMAGNLEFVEGTTNVSFGISAVLIFLLILVGGMFWVSSAINAKKDIEP